MDYQEMKRKTEELLNVNYLNIDIDDVLSYLKRVILDYDYNVSVLAENRALIGYDYLINFFHKFCCKIYGNYTQYEISLDGTNSYFDSFLKKISYGRASVNAYKSPAFYHAFTVFHENRHAMQDVMYYQEPENILNIDPLALVMLKENLLSRFENHIYISNHSDFVMENDANLVAQKFLKSFIIEYFPNKSREYLEQVNERIKEEKTRFGKLLVNNPEKIVNHRFGKAEMGILPVFYEASKVFRDNVSAELVCEFPILKLICNLDGKIKSYEEILYDKEKFFGSVVGMSKVKTVDAFSGEDGYEYMCYRLPVEHVGFVYDVIINSDPLYYIEDCINHNRFNEVSSLLSSCSELFEQYGVEINDIYMKYITTDNYYTVVASFNSQMENQLCFNLYNKYKKLVKDEVSALIDFKISPFVVADSNMVKEVERLLSEETFINTALHNMVVKGRLTYEKCEEYCRIISEFYDNFKDDSRLAHKAYIIDENNNDSKELENIIANRIEKITSSNEDDDIVV